MEKQKTTDINQLDHVLTAIFFVIPFFGLRIAFENYLMEDQLEMSYFLLIGFISGLISSVYMLFLKPKSIKVKVFGVIVLLGLIVICNLLVL